MISYAWLALLLDFVYAEAIYTVDMKSNKKLRGEVWEDLIAEGKLLSYRRWGMEFGPNPNLFGRDEGKIK